MRVKNVLTCNKEKEIFEWKIFPAYIQQQEFISRFVSGDKWSQSPIRVAIRRCLLGTELLRDKNM